MSQSYFRSPSGIEAIFGKPAYKQLVLLLDPCCHIADVNDPTQKYTLTQEVTSGTTHQFTVNSVATMVGSLGYTLYASDNGGGWALKSNFFLPTGIVQDTDTILGTSALTAGHSWQLVITDSRGNWSNIITVTT